MTASVIHKPAQRHKCVIGWKLTPLPDNHPARTTGHTAYYIQDGQWDPDGTIRACAECGKTWVAHRLRPSGHVSLIASWRPEGRFARWRRERKAARKDTH